MKRIIISTIWVLLLLQACKNRNPHQGLPDGINETKYPDGKTHEQFYIADSKLNGIYREFNEKGDIIRTSTYKNDMRYGFWDTSLSAGHMSQFFYQNDTIVSLARNKMFFKTHLYLDKNFVYISQTNWSVKEDTINGVDYIIGKLINFQGHFTPSFTIHRQEPEAKSVESLIDSAIVEDKRLGRIDLKKDVDIISRRIVLDNDTIVFDSKVIKNNYGYWVMTCSTSDSNYVDDQFLFRAMLNSFTPICIQK